MSIELFGRRKIFTGESNINKENIIDVVNFSLSAHMRNSAEMDYLYWYKRGKQPILNREKKIRPEIKNIVVENHAKEICAFKNGYFLTQPAYYISRKKDDTINEKVNRLNEYLYLSGKHAVDNEVVNWFHTVGIGTLYIKPQNDKNIPVAVYTLDPRNSFVVYSYAPGNKPMLGVNTVITENGQLIVDAITEDYIFKLRSDNIGKVNMEIPANGYAFKVDSVEKNVLGKIPIIEYQYDEDRMGSFEGVLSLLDAINKVQSNRIDGVEQFIQSLMVIYNAEVDEEKAANMRAYGLVTLKSVGELKADLKLLSEQLDQTQTQILVEKMYNIVLTICGMPSTTKGGNSTSDTGAAVLYRDGWYQADVIARNTTDLFKKSNRYFDEIFIDILRRKTDLDINLSDFELQFVRNETANLLVKTQAALNLKQLGLSPELTLAKSGVSNDAVADVANSREYINKVWNTEPDNINFNINEDEEERIDEV